MTITVSLPYYRTPETVRRAVESILNQTYRDLLVVVVNDGDGPECWEPLEGIDDPRLVRFDLPMNRGRYFSDAVTLRACETPFWTPHDSDDWSEPDRFEKLVSGMTPETDVVFGGYRNHGLGGQIGDKMPELQRMVRSPELVHVAHHSALYRTESLRRIGGPHPGYRVAWDTFQVGVVANLLRWEIVPIPLYHYCQRSESLVLSPDTGMKSEYRRKLWMKLSDAWERFIETGALPRWSRAQRRLVRHHAARLRGVLQ